ncbi:MAG TPA: DUF2802 domain-containing protein [Thiobacillaceae bacterium]|nr:DUF2802 domain-containing protein [Thiobacillaceae bacterium]HNU65120.1 DUF2802 domain-containing protein [Thiobacillaceae bacterium]
MLENLTFTARELLVAVVLASLVYLLEAVFFSRRRATRRENALQTRLDGIEEELAALRTRLESVELRPPVDSALDTQKAMYAEAIRMARAGTTAQELARQLGISLTEADLIIALHKDGS